MQKAVSSKYANFSRKNQIPHFCLECFQENEDFRDVTMDDDTLVDGSGTAADDSALFKTPAAPTRGTKRRQIDDLASAVSGVSISTGQVQFKII